MKIQQTFCKCWKKFRKIAKNGNFQKIQLDNRVDFENAAKRVFSCKNRSRYSRKRATFCRNFANRRSPTDARRSPDDRSRSWRSSHLSSQGCRTARSGKLYRARSRLYRSEILQENMRWKALAEIYTMRSFAQLCNLNFPSKICQQIR